MWSSLATTFGDIYVLNLHGSVKRQERAPDGGLDENVFDIHQGICIALFVKRKGDLAGPRVHYADLWGTRESKYEWLGANALGAPHGPTWHLPLPSFGLCQEEQKEPKSAKRCVDWTSYSKSTPVVSKRSETKWP